MFNFKLNSEISEIEGVYRFQIDFPPFDGLKFVCIYLLNVDNHNVLIDAGLHIGSWKNLFFKELKKLNLTISDIDYCIITHDHLDHVGLIKIFKRRNPDIKILMHEFTDEILHMQNNFNQVENTSMELADQMVKFGISKEQGDRIVQFFTSWSKLISYYKPDRILNDNDEIVIGSEKLKVIFTPGHAAGHICVFDENKRNLFSGDHILSRITPHIGNFVVSPLVKKKYDFTNILDYYLKSLDRIDNLNSKLIFPAHQEVIYNPHERIMEIKKHHEIRLKEISEIIKDKPMTPLRISQIHFGDDLSQLNIFLAVSEVLGHLIYLENQGKVTRIEKNEKFLFFS